MSFWAKIVIRYFVAALSALLLAFAVSVVVTLSIIHEGDDLGSGFLLVLIFVPLACLFISASLGITAELIQRKVSLRPFAWPKALLRTVIALPIAIGPLLNLTGYLEDHRPMRWPVDHAILLVMCAIFAYFALRITKPPSLS